MNGFVENIVSGVVSAAAFAGAVGVLIKFVKPFGNFVRTRIKCIADTDRITSELETVKDKIEVMNQIESGQERQLFILEGVAKACLFNSIQGMYFAVREKNGITDLQRRELIILYEKYRGLGGDGYITEIKDAMLELHTIV